MRPQSIPHRYIGDPALGRFTVDFEIANYGDMLQYRQGSMAPEKMRRLIIKGLVDPGSTKLILPEGVSTQLGLSVQGKVRVTYGDGRYFLRKQVEGVYVNIQGRGGVFQAVLEPKRQTALIGAIVLEDLDLLVDCNQERLLPRDPKFVINEID